MHRLFIVLPIYALVVIFLPQQLWFRPFADEVAGIDPDVTFWVSASLGAAATLALWVVRNRPFAWMFQRPRVTEVIGMGLLGIIFAAVFNIFEKLGNIHISLVSMILLPIGFMVSEAVYLAIQWRLQRKDMGDDD
jgi:hypothetical protein